MSNEKPREVHGRVAEWDALSGFANSSTPAGGVGLLYGRRRTGKSFLLRRLVASVGGLYFQATESDRTQALAEFGAAVATSDAEKTGRLPEPVQYADWFDALSRRAGLVVIDELPYLLVHSPELPSLLQRLADEASNGARDPVRFILCGSSLSVMTTLLRGQEPLRGRATLDLLLRPMDHVDAAQLWGVEDLEIAVRLHAIFGGAPGYRALTEGAPSSVEDLGRWLSGNILSPTHALYREDDYLLQEERTITDRMLYGSILRLIANGVSSQSEMSARLGRSRESLAFPLATLIKAGFVVRSVDILHANKPEHRLADPIIRFLRLVVDPARQLLDEGRWHPVWARSVHRLDANVYGPHLEGITHRWAILGFEPSTNGFVSAAGPTRVADPKTRKAIELDCVALGESTSGKAAIELIAEVKWSPEQFGPDPLERLARARDLLNVAGHDVSRCELALVSRAAPNHSGEGIRIGLTDLYSKSMHT